MEEYLPIFMSLDRSLRIMTVIAVIVLILLIVIIVRVTKTAKAKKRDGRPVSLALKAATIACYVVIALIITSPFWIDLTPIMDKLKEIV